MILFTLVTPDAYEPLLTGCGIKGIKEKPQTELIEKKWMGRRH